MQGDVRALKGLSMEKWLCWISMGVSGLLLLLFLLDFFLSIPFGGISGTVDVVCILASALVLYLSWETLREWK